MEEIVGATVQRTYTYGLRRISQNWPGAATVPNFYGYDSMALVAFLE